MCLQYEPHHIGAAVTYLATIQLSIKPSSSRSPETTWLELLEKDIDPYLLRTISLEIVDLYDNRAYLMYTRLEDDERKHMRDAIMNGANNNDKDNSGGGGDSARETKVLSGGSTPVSPGEGDAAGLEQPQYGNQGEEDEFERRKPQVTVTVVKNAQLYFQGKYLSSSSSTAQETPVPPPPPASDMDVDEDAGHGHSVLYSEADETPYVPPPPPPTDTPSSTPRFSDLVPRVRVKERSNSLTDHNGMDLKRPRTE